LVAVGLVCWGSLLLSGCGEPAKHKLVGRWETKDPKGLRNGMVLKNDGTLFLTQEEQVMFADKAEAFRMRYELDDPARPTTMDWVPVGLDGKDLRLPDGKRPRLKFLLEVQAEDKLRLAALRNKPDERPSRMEGEGIEMREFTRVP